MKRRSSRPAGSLSNPAGCGPARASLASRNADLLFRVISMRYEKKPVVLTTNLGFPDWRQIFPNAACTVALIDRIVHHADVITIEGSSYRLKEAKERPARRTLRRKAHT